MSTINDLHARAMEHADQALMARKRGETALAVETFREALRCEIAPSMNCMSIANDAFYSAP